MIRRPAGGGHLGKLDFMKKALLTTAITLPILALAAVAFVTITHVRIASATSITCTPTGFYRDGINMTAAKINPHGAVSSTVNAIGCNIGVYYGPGAEGAVRHATIYGANYFGVVNNGGRVTISHSLIHDIGESPFNGTQHGVGVYFVYASGATGEISNSRIWRYQKGGIVVNGTGDSANVSYNTVTGLGPIGFIAQNGIQIGYGAHATVTHNTVSDNSYTGTSTVDGGIIVVGGAYYGSDYTVGTVISHNTVTNNDVGVWVTDIDQNANPSATPTNVVVSENHISDNAVTNNYGAVGYQAGVADQGDYDQITNNHICGTGYTSTVASPYLYYIDVTATNNPTVSGNITGQCNGDGVVSTKTEPPAHGPDAIHTTDGGSDRPSATP